LQESGTRPRGRAPSAGGPPTSTPAVPSIPSLSKHPGPSGAGRPHDCRRAQEAMIGPATEAGLLLEPSLVETVLADLGDEPGSLPLVSHALFATWQRRRGPVPGRGRLTARRRRAAHDRPPRRA